MRPELLRVLFAKMSILSVSTATLCGRRSPCRSSRQDANFEISCPLSSQLLGACPSGIASTQLFLVSALRHKPPCHPAQSPRYPHAIRHDSELIGHFFAFGNWS